MKQRLKQLVQRVVLAITLLIALTQFMTLPAHAIELEDVPALVAGDRTWVRDLADVLSRDTEGRLNRVLDDLERTTGKSVRIVTLRHLDYGDTSAAVASGLFEQWFQTPAEQANQTLLLLDTRSREAALQVGEQIKALLPDDLVESITNETMAPQIREGNLNQALLAGASRLSAVLSGLDDPGPPQVTQAVAPTATFPGETDTGDAAKLVGFLLLAAVLIPMVTYYAYRIWS
ncbi:photosystem II repair protein Psb32 [Leptolyngbya sp. FACHB-261]|uniref:photosystem II repair protein Psb32 n=1 Tax=Leptolyngbya sp. FACHB-261 TaxID=2692806 RepID=UPI001687D235|nr:TPM domain-containing protein [Leptolyngbya sp. FACHB-261]MBD2104812.1 TPM domain-containing protein [Leptolyngbya sp. FACHB-261]